MGVDRLRNPAKTRFPWPRSGGSESRTGFLPFARTFERSEFVINDIILYIYCIIDSRRKYNRSNGRKYYNVSSTFVNSTAQHLPVNSNRSSSSNPFVGDLSGKFQTLIDFVFNVSLFCHESFFKHRCVGKHIRVNSLFFNKVQQIKKNIFSPK